MTAIRRLLVVLATCATVLVAGPIPITAAGPDDHTHLVQHGDTLYGIAREHGVSLSALLQANDLKVQSVILPGERLAIPTTSARPAPRSASGSTHTVVRGDALSAIAARYRVSLASLLKLNGLTVNSVILPGHRLEIPAKAGAPTTASARPAPRSASGSTHTVVRGDALSAIAARYRVSLASLLKLNGLTVNSVILPGHRLEIPAKASAPVRRTSSSSTTPRIDTVVSYARAQIGKPYAFFTKGPDTFDCSGLTAAAYAQVGVTLVHYSAAQALQGHAVDFANDPIRPGDLIFLKRRGSDRINHVGIATSSTTWIQATGPGDTVRSGRLPAKNTISAVRRFIGS